MKPDLLEIKYKPKLEHVAILLEYIEKLLAEIRELENELQELADEHAGCESGT